MIPTLPVLAMVLGAYATVFRNLGTLTRASFLPMLVLISLVGLEVATEPGILLSLLFWLAGLPFAALIAVACHRVVLLGPDSLDSPWSMFWSNRESSFFVWLIILGITLYIAGLVIGTVFLMAPDGVIRFVLTVFAITYIEGRFSMVLPATAIGNRMFLSNSWYLTAGNGPRIAIALLLPLAALWGVVSLSGTLMLVVPLAVYITIIVISFLITIAVEIAVLSLSYQFLRDSTQTPMSEG